MLVYIVNIFNDYQFHFRPVYAGEIYTPPINRGGLREDWAWPGSEYLALMGYPETVIGELEAPVTGVRQAISDAHVAYVTIDEVDYSINDVHDGHVMLKNHETGEIKKFPLKPVI